MLSQARECGSHISKAAKALDTMISSYHLAPSIASNNLQIRAWINCLQMKLKSVLTCCSRKKALSIFTRSKNNKFNLISHYLYCLDS